MSTIANTNNEKKYEDKLVLGGHEFTSRFILGSGKFSLDLVKACIEKSRCTDDYTGFTSRK